MQGFNMGRYVPPDQEGVASGNRLLGNRAQKATSAGVPIVRFEMPFAVWCDGCEARTIGRDGKTHPVLIGQGVRFNAEKHRTGNYYSTPIWMFRMRHPACGTWLAIRTDPATTSYIVAEGGRRRREYSDDDDDDHEAGRGWGLSPAAAAARSAAALAGGHGHGRGLGEDDPELDRLDAFDRLERTIHHRQPAAGVNTGKDGGDDAPLSGRDAAKRLEALTQSNARQWDDPYARNRALRAAFRVGRHAREQAAADDDSLRERLGGLSEDLHLLPATEADAQHAALVDFGSRPSGGETPSAVVDRRTLAKPLLFVGDRHRPHATMPRGRVSCAPAFAGTPMAAGSVSMPELSASAASPLSSASRSRTYVATTETAKRQRAIRDHLASTVLANTRLTTDPFVAALSGGDTTPTPGKARLPIKGLKGLKRSATAAELAQRAETEGDSSEPPVRDPKRQRGAGEEMDGATPSKVTGAALVSYDSD
ncbi:Protein saf4 [Sporothrix curviconia]|uniref:Protein saf4 n=1 Tax=Sporothrix curviconia TaxID=1260050 RepID=A0ABP0CI76_9PEZI